MKRLVCVLVALCIATLGLTQTATGAERYSSCSQLQKDFPRGVAKSKAAANAAVKAGFQRPSIRAGLYAENSGRLDVDDDGVMCEKKAGSKPTPPSTSTKEPCEVGRTGFTFEPGNEWVPWAVELVNRNPNVDADWVSVDVLLIDQNNVVVRQDSEIIDGIPAGKSLYVGDQTILDNPLAVTNLTMRVSVECDSEAKSNSPVLTGPATATPGALNSYQVSATVANPTSKALRSTTFIYMIAFDAAGNPLGGVSTIMYTDLPPGLSVAKQTNLWSRLGGRLASMQYFVEPD